MVRAVAPDARAFVRSQAAVHRSVLGYHGDFQLYEGIYVAVYDASGSLLRVVALSARGGGGGDWARPDVRYMARATGYPSTYFVPLGSSRWIRRPATLRLSPTALVTRVRLPGNLTRGLWGSGVLRACGTCRPTKVLVRLVHEEGAGCGASVWRDVEVKQPGARVRTYRVGSAPPCLGTRDHAAPRL